MSEFRLVRSPVAGVRCRSSGRRSRCRSSSGGALQKRGQPRAVDVAARHDDRDTAPEDVGAAADERRDGGGAGPFRDEMLGVHQPDNRGRQVVFGDRVDPVDELAG